MFSLLWIEVESSPYLVLSYWFQNYPSVRLAIVSVLSDAIVLFIVCCIIYRLFKHLLYTAALLWALNQLFIYKKNTARMKNRITKKIAEEYLKFNSKMTEMKVSHRYFQWFQKILMQFRSILEEFLKIFDRFSIDFGRIFKICEWFRWDFDGILEGFWSILEEFLRFLNDFNWFRWNFDRFCKDFQDFR